MKRKIQKGFGLKQIHLPVILLEIVHYFHWQPYFIPVWLKNDFKSAILQTGGALRDIYVVPPKESEDKKHYWFLLDASYGLVNANAKLQQYSDDLFWSLGLNRVAYFPQLLNSHDDSGKFQGIKVKIVNEVFIAAEKSATDVIVHEIQRKYDVGTVVYCYGNFLIFRRQIC